ncbi:heparinase II/III family protein [Haloferula sp. A504]|uniref:heparinase II/III domain-containing protein n=1 Tax=Haloferula sp. A504 TaxID=3373601 RepID=UPI0031C382A7|nr:heparinase II/III family protein [Verrucomicrobiaceae bacterium E54]
MKRAFLVPALAAGLLGGTSHAAGPADPLATLQPGHPRLLVREGDWDRLKTRAGADPMLGQVTDRIVADATALLDEPPLERIKTGRRLLSVSREGLERVMLWSMARHLTGEKRYADRAEKELLQLAAFTDWNPSHFLDVAEMTAALGIGYDWLFDDLPPESREAIREAILEKGLAPGSKDSWWWKHRDNNWNQVCFGGLTLGALAIADTNPEPARQLLDAARKGIGHGLGTYAPDGLYPEGPGYWSYGTVYQCLMIDALRSALGTSWELEKAPGFLESAAAQVELTGPTGQFFNFFDGHAGPSLQPARFWFARELEDPGLLLFQRGPLEKILHRRGHSSRLLVPVALWWAGLPESSQAPELPLAWKADGPNPVAIFRSSWTDPNALYLACKGGSADLSHAHMDAGSFVLEADGVRWAVDLGSQGYYSLESQGIRLWDDGQNGQRWSVYRLNNRSHNTLTINDQLHRVRGSGRITDFSPRGATLDLSPVFQGQATAVTREFQVEDRKVVVLDQLRGLEPGTTVRWTMVTRADVTPEDRQATLSQDGKTLDARLSHPADARFRVLDAAPPEDDFNAPNPGARLLVVEAPAPESGELRIRISLEPGS